MSVTLLEFTRSFVDGRMTADIFSDAFQELWKIERDRKILQDDDDRLSECLSSIFCLADLYNQDLSRAEYEINSDQLHDKVKELIDAFDGEKE